MNLCSLFIKKAGLSGSSPWLIHDFSNSCSRDKSMPFNWLFIQPFKAAYIHK